MTLRKYGSLTYARQPGSQLVYNADGTITGQIVYVGDASYASTMRSLLSTAHPDNASVYLHTVTERRLRGDRVECVFDCFGIGTSPTDKVPLYQPQITTAPIETHPDFATFAGTPSAPLNNAYFDPETSEFVAFTSGSKAGVRSYYTGSVVVRATYYTSTNPSFTAACKIKETLSGIPEVAGVTNWLYLPPNWEKIPNTPYYKVTEEWLGSTGDGWDTDIYSS